MNFYQMEGTIRARLPEETLSIIEPYIKQAGITRIANLTYLDDLDIPVYTCIRPNSKNITTSQGKGLTDLLAQCSAYMESIEHYFSETCTPEIIGKSFSELKNSQFIHPKLLKTGPLSINLDDCHFDWIQGNDLISMSQNYIPLNYIKLDYSCAEYANNAFLRSSTGLASGNTLQEAYCHALYEIIEKNCLSKFNSLKMAEKNLLLLDLSTIDSLSINCLIDHIQLKKNTILIFNITNIFNVPCYYCVIISNNPLRNIGWHSGSGAHYSKEIALFRAITEAAQSRLTYIAGSRDDILPIEYKVKKSDFHRKGTLHYKVTESGKINSFEIQLDQIKNSLYQHGYEKIIAIPYTTSKEAISVARLIVPGLQI